MTPAAFEAVYDQISNMSTDGGFGSPEVMQAFVDQTVASGELPPGFDWGGCVDTKYVWSAQKDLGLPQRPPSP